MLQIFSTHSTIIWFQGHILNIMNSWMFLNEPLEDTTGVVKQTSPCLTSTWWSHLYGTNVSWVRRRSLQVFAVFSWWALLAVGRSWLQRALPQSWQVFFRDLPSAVRVTGGTSAWGWGGPGVSTAPLRRNSLTTDNDTLNKLKTLCATCWMHFLPHNAFAFQILHCLPPGLLASSPLPLHFLAHNRDLKFTGIMWYHW